MSVQKLQDVSRHKSFMSRMSSVLLPRKGTPIKLKSKLKSKSDSLIRKGIAQAAGNDQYSISSKGDCDEAIDDPGYSSVRELQKVDNYQSKAENSPPPVPPKHLEELYARVTKKATKEMSCNTEGTFIDNASHSDNDGSSAQHLQSLPFPKKEHRSKRMFADACVENSESSPDEAKAIEYMMKQEKKLTRKSRASKHRQKHTANKSKKSSSLIPVNPKSIDTSQLPEAYHKQKFIAKEVEDDFHKKPQSQSSMSRATEQLIYDEAVNKLQLKHKEEMQLLQQEMHRTDEENTALRAKVASLLQQEIKWKREANKAIQKQQDFLNSVEANNELNRRIAKLEIDTRQEIQLLAQQMKNMRQEKDLLMEQLQAAQCENEVLQKKYSEIRLQSQSMVSVERHVSSLRDNKKFLEEMKKMHEQEISKLQKIYGTIEEEKNSLSVEVLLLKEEQKRIKSENDELNAKVSAIDSEKSDILQELQKEKAQNKEIADLLSSLVRTTEQLVIERDVLFKKSKLQEHQHQMIHSSVMQHTMNIGRLEEHIVNLRKRMNDEVTKVMVSKHDKDLDYNNMKESYERQLEFFRTKIMQKNLLLEALSKEKRQAEIDMENLWEATLMSKKQTDSQQNNMLNNTA